jgi:hypothetical protein
VPGTIRSLLREERPIVRSDGRFVRDYLYVEDAADGVAMLTEALATRPELAGEAFTVLPEYPGTYQMMRTASTVSPTLARVGLLGLLLRAEERTFDPSDSSRFDEVTVDDAEIHRCQRSRATAAACRAVRA